MFQHGLVENAASHAYDSFTSLYSSPLLHNHRRSVGMLWCLSEKATDAVSPSGQPLLLVAFGCGHVVGCLAINHVGVDLRVRVDSTLIHEARGQSCVYIAHSNCSLRPSFSHWSTPLSPVSSASRLRTRLGTRLAQNVVFLT